MKPLDDVKKALSSLFTGLDLRVVAALLLPLLAAGAVFLYTRYKARQAARKAAPAPPPAAQAQPANTALERTQLRRVWSRFLDKLPWKYRRSILSFDHYVVLGAEGSGKSDIINRYTDWHRQEQGTVASLTDDKDLSVYLASHALVMEVSSKILRDHGVECRTALSQLFRPLYRLRSPVVVVVVDAAALLASPDVEVMDLAGAVRGKINLLSAIRRRSLEVRVVLTRLSALPNGAGYADFAKLCRAQDIPLFVALPRKGKLGERLEGWLEEARLHLPRLLTSVDATAYRGVVRFFRGASRIFGSGSKLDLFLDAIFTHDAISPDPERGGLYLGADPPGTPNPLRAPLRRERGPDPQLRHLIAAAVAASAGMTFLSVAYFQQRALYQGAREALDRYQPTMIEGEAEQRQRSTIDAFTVGRDSWLDTHPDFFERSREEMRARFSRTLQERLLVEGLRRVVDDVPDAENALESQGKLPFQRSLYYLALIHSDRNDHLGIARRDAGGRDHLEIWSRMTGIEPAIISDYLRNTDRPFREAVSFTVPRSASDPYDTKKPWREFVAALNQIKRNRRVSAGDLEEIQKKAVELDRQVYRLENADITLGIIDEIERYGLSSDAASGATDSEERRLSLAVGEIYAQKYSGFLGEYQAFQALDAEQLREVLGIVRRGALTVDGAHGLLNDLLAGLEGLYEEKPGATVPRGFLFDGDFVDLKESEWNAIIRDSRASLLIESFLKSDGQRSIFFKPGSDDVAPVSFSPMDNTAAIFTGRSVLDGQYTRTSYNVRVREPVLRLRRFLESVERFEADEKNHELDHGRLLEHVRRHVTRYAGDYQRRAAQFVQGFQISTPSAEALRIAIAQMSDKSGSGSFDDFLRTVDQNTLLDTQDPKTRAEEPMLAPMKRVTSDFARWHEVVDGNGATPKITQYKAILEQMLADLTSSEDAGEGATRPASAKQAPGEGGGKGRETLEDALTPTGRLALAGMRRDPGAYSALISGWVRSSGLPAEQRGPFLIPVARLHAVGSSDVQSVVGRSVRKEVIAPLGPITSRFPFDAGSDEEVTAEQLTEMFHPKTGRFYEAFRRYLEPVSQVDGPGGFRGRPSVKEGVDLPESTYRLINAVALLSARLWDENGKPRPLTFTLTTVPFGGVPSGAGALSLVFVNVGEASLVNFNQKPATRTLELDWTKPSSSRVGVQLIDIKTKDSTVPKPLAVEGSGFSFLKLLKKARRAPVDPNQPSGAQLYTWELPLDGGAVVQAKFILSENPWDVFTLRKAVNEAGAQ